MKESMKEFAVWLEGDENAKRIVAVLQTIAAGSATLYRIHHGYEDYYAKVFVGSMSLVLLSSLIVICFYQRYGLNRLYLQKRTGLLYDKNMQTPNVALRRKTMQTIVTRFEELTDSQKLKEVGLEIGTDFANFYLEKRRFAHKELSAEQLLKDIFKYDASSGLGIFEITSYAPQVKKRLDISVKNPFAESADPSRLSPWLLGYLSGICSVLLDAKFVVTAHERDAQGDIQIYPITLHES